MKKFLIILVVILLFTVNSKAQYPIVEEFNPGTSWTFTNGAGIQNYGGAENYATTNIGSTPYPNNATVTITSPVYDLSNCGGVLTISFPLSGIIENGWDFLYFQYRIGAGAWITIQSFTGNQGATFTYTTIPNTATQFRFRLITDSSVNDYYDWFWNTWFVYYYDITRFTIDCDNVLPITLIDFSGFDEGDYNYLQWSTSSEINNDYFTIEKSENAIHWSELGRVDGSGNSSVEKSYSYVDKNPYAGTTYYRLKQTDYNGNFEYFNIIAIENNNSIFFVYTRGGDGNLHFNNKYEFQLYDLMGKLVKSGYDDNITSSSLSSGMYVLRIGNYTKRIILR